MKQSVGKCKQIDFKNLCVIYGLIYVCSDILYEEQARAKEQHGLDIRHVNALSWCSNTSEDDHMPPPPKVMFLHQFLIMRSLTGGKCVCKQATVTISINFRKRVF